METVRFVHSILWSREKSAHNEGTHPIEPAAQQGVSIQAGIVWSKDGQACRKVSKFVSNARAKMKINQSKSIG